MFFRKPTEKDTGSILQNKGTVLCFKTIFYLTKKRNKTIEIFEETGGKLISTVLELTGFRVNMIFRV